MIRSDARFRMVGRFGTLLLNGLFATTRFDVEGAEHYQRFRREGRPVILVLWHGRLLPLTYVHRRQGIVTLISRSEDGEYIARVVEAWGYRTVRGSSSRGGTAAVRGLLRHARKGRTLSFTPDGPRGPRQRMKPGVLTAARLTGFPVVPMAAGTERGWWVGGWDRFLVPKPFSRIRVAYGRPHWIERDADEATLERRGRELEEALNRVTERVDDGRDG